MKPFLTISQIQEYLDDIKFSDNKAKDLNIAEQIAENGYQSYEDLRDTCVRAATVKYGKIIASKKLPINYNIVSKDLMDAARSGDQKAIDKIRKFNISDFKEVIELEKPTNKMWYVLYWFITCAGEPDDGFMDAIYNLVKD